MQSRTIKSSLCIMVRRKRRRYGRFWKAYAYRWLAVSQTASASLRATHAAAIFVDGQRPIRGNSWRTGYRRALGRRTLHAADSSINYPSASISVRSWDDSFALPPHPPSPLSSSKSITHPYLLAPGLNDEERYAGRLARSLAGFQRSL